MTINPLTKKEYVKTKCICLKCRNVLYDTDLEEYNFTCLYCDENFYNCEVYYGNIMDNVRINKNDN